MQSTQLSNPLEQWANNHQGNFMHKWSHYFDIYHKHFERFRDKPIRILEIGIYGGGSLQMWKWYFGKKAKIVGLDIDPHCRKYAEPRIKIKIGDQTDEKLLKSLGKFDIILDDGGHTMAQQIISIQNLYEHVNDNGIYMVEDTHTSYMPDYQDTDLTFIDYSKRLIDLMHTHYAGQPFNSFASCTDSITYYDSVVVLEKKNKIKPTPVHYSGVNRT